MLYVGKLRFSTIKLLSLFYSIPGHQNIISEKITWIAIEPNGTSVFSEPTSYYLSNELLLSNFDLVVLQF